MSEPHIVSKPSGLDPYRENQILHGKLWEARSLLPDWLPETASEMVEFVKGDPVDIAIRLIRLVRALNNAVTDAEVSREEKFEEIEEKLEAAEAERDEAKGQLLAVRAYLADGEIRGAIGGDMAKVFALSLVEFYHASGGANYVEMGIADTRNGERFTVLVQRVEGKSPHELRVIAEERARKLEEALRNAVEMIHDANGPLEYAKANDWMRGQLLALQTPPPEAEKRGEG